MLRVSPIHARVAYKCSSACRRPAISMDALVFCNEVLSLFVSIKLVTGEKSLG